MFVPRRYDRLAGKKAAPGIIMGETCLYQGSMIYKRVKSSTLIHKGLNMFEPSRYDIQAGEKVTLECMFNKQSQMYLMISTYNYLTKVIFIAHMLFKAIL